MTSVSTSSLVTLGAGLAGAAFVGYCVYFDNKRRSAPDFKAKLMEKRRAAKQKMGGGSGGGDGDPFASRGMPSSATEMQAFFMQELQTGEELLAAGDIMNGVSHMANAVAMCGQPGQIMQVLQQTLPPEVFELLVQSVPAAQERVMNAMMATRGGGGIDGPPVVVAEEDVDGGMADGTARVTEMLDEVELE